MNSRGSGVRVPQCSPDEAKRNPGKSVPAWRHCEAAKAAEAIPRGGDCFASLAMTRRDFHMGDILRNPVKDKLARDEVVASMTVRLVRNVEIASIARTAGFDTLYIDVEHS